MYDKTASEMVTEVAKGDKIQLLVNRFLTFYILQHKMSSCGICVTYLSKLLITQALYLVVSLIINVI